MSAAVDERHTRDGGAGAGGEHGLLAAALGTAINAQRSGGIALAHVGLRAVEHQVGRERDEPQAALAARFGHPAGQPGVHELGLFRAGCAQIRATQHGRVHDGLRARLVDEARD
jgi:hypothetical protein